MDNKEVETRLNLLFDFIYLHIKATGKQAEQEIADILKEGWIKK